MFMEAAALPCGKASGIWGNRRILIHIYETWSPLVAACGKSMSNRPPNPAAPGILLGIGQIDTVAGIRHFISLFCVFLDGQAAPLVQAGFSAKTACLRGKGAAYSVCGIDAVSLCSGQDLYKR